MRAEELYPVGYEIDHLFTDFKTRKWERDIERGSKKAHKKLLKETRQRQAARNENAEKKNNRFTMAYAGLEELAIKTDN